ncbi:MAG: hypothetical protein ACRC7V_03715 [Lachnospiraceae bacterium]
MRNEKKIVITLMLVACFMVFTIGCNSSKSDTTTVETMVETMQEDVTVDTKENMTENKMENTEITSDNPWGKIPYSSDLESMLLQGMSKDYFIKYFAQTTESVYPNLDDLSEFTDYACQYYFVVSFTEEGYLNTRANSVYVFETVDDAKAVEAFWISQEISNRKIDRVDNVLMQYNYEEGQAEYSKDEYDMKESYLSNYPIAKGEMEATSDNELLYLAIPLK